MLNRKDQIPLDFGNPKFNKSSTIQPIWINDIYPIKFFPNYIVTLIYKTSIDDELPKLISTINVNQFIILEPLEHRRDEFFRLLLLINQDYCLIISFKTPNVPLVLYDFFKSITSSVVLFPNQQKMEQFSIFFKICFYHVQYYEDSSIINNFISFLKEDDKKREFFDCQVNQDLSIMYTLYEAISQTISSVFVYFIKRHDFFKYKIQVNQKVDFSMNFKILDTIYSCNTYKLLVVFHTVCNMFFIYKVLIGKNSKINAYNEKRYIELQSLHSFLRLFGLYRYGDKESQNLEFVIVYEYTPLFKLTDQGISKKTIESCLLNLLKELDSIHSIEFVVNTLNVNTVLFSYNNSIFFSNYHEFSNKSREFELDMHEFGEMIKKLDVNNKYLNELALCNQKDLSRKNIFPCFPVTQYFIYRTRQYKKKKSENDSDYNYYDGFTFNENRKDNQVLFDQRNQNNVNVIKTLLFCYASGCDITSLLNRLPKAESNPSIYLSFGEEMLDFNEQKGIQILNKVIEIKSNFTLQQEKAYYIIAKYYFFKKEYLNARDYFNKIAEDGKIYYIISRMYQKKLFLDTFEESTNSITYLSKSSELKYWRSLYREGLKKMELAKSKQNSDNSIQLFNEAIQLFNEALNNIENDIEGDIDLFGLLGDDYDYLYGMISYNLALCYKSIKDYDMMITYFKDAKKKRCKLAYAPLAYIYLTSNYAKSFKLLQKASEYIPLNLRLIIEVNFKLINRMIDAMQVEDARHFLNLAIKLYANSYKFNDDVMKNTLIKYIQKYSIMIANQFNMHGKYLDAFPCFALSAAFSDYAGFFGLAQMFYHGKGVRKSMINTLVCLKQFFILHQNNEQKFDQIIDDLINEYPIYMQRTSYFEIGSILFYSSRNPYMPFDFLIKASSLALSQVIIKDIKYLKHNDDKECVVVDSVLKYFQYIDIQQPNQEQQQIEGEESSNQYQV